MTVGTASTESERARFNLWDQFPRVLGYALAIGFWIWASGSLIDSQFLPKPWTILENMRDILVDGMLWTHFSATVIKLAIGFLLSFVIGVALALAMANSWWDAFFRDWMIAALTTPGLVFALIAALIFGFSPFGPIAAIIVTSTPFVMVNAVEGVKARPRDLISMSRSFGVSRTRRLRWITLPALAPYLFAALRYGFSQAWKIATLTELFGSSEGIGFMVKQNFTIFDIGGLLAWVFYFFAFALFLERVVLERAMKRAFRWRDGS